MTIHIQSLSANAGEKSQGFLTVVGGGAELPCTILRGSRPGKTVLMTAGIHAAEYPGIQALIELAQEIEADAVAGTLLLVPIANPTGFRALMPWNVPEDGQNLNRMFPGKADGTLSERIAYTITHDLQAKADFYIDLHAGDLHESLIPYVYYPSATTEAVAAESLAAAQVLAVPYRVRSTATTGAYNSAAVRGVPSLLLERGGCGLWSRDEVTAYKQDLYRLLAHFGVLEQECPAVNAQQVELTRAFYPSAGIDGLWYPAVEAGNAVKQGQPLGEIRDCFGTLLEQFVAEAHGVVLYRTASLSIRKGDPTVAYGSE